MSGSLIVWELQHAQYSLQYVLCISEKALSRAPSANQPALRLASIIRFLHDKHNTNSAYEGRNY